MPLLLSPISYLGQGEENTIVSLLILSAWQRLWGVMWGLVGKKNSQYIFSGHCPYNVIDGETVCGDGVSFQYVILSLSLVSKIKIKEIVWLLRSLELVMFPYMSLWRRTGANH